MKSIRFRAKFVLPAIAIASMLFGVSYAIHSQRRLPFKSPPVAPSSNPFGTVVAGTGFVEPSTESSMQSTISIGSQVAGVVSKVLVHIDQKVQEGDLLFQLDSRNARAELAVRQAAHIAAQAQLDKLTQQPRPEEIPPLEAQVQANLAALATAKDVLDRDRKLAATKSITEQEVFASIESVENAQAQLELSRANLNLLKAGAWEPDKVIARTAVEQAKAQVAQAQTTLEILDVRAPASGTVLQINIRPGEFVSTSALQSLMTMGNLQPYHVRVSIDEEDIPRLKLDAPAIANLRGDPERRHVALKYVRIEPAVIPKTSLTGANTERVDTRVMQVIYAIDPDDPLVRERKILCGQLLDVFIDVK